MQMEKNINSISPTITYEGDVTLKIYNEAKLVKSITKYNSGTDKLFSFIQSCLRGSFEEAKSARPSKLIILKAGATTGEGLIDDKHSTPEGETGREFWNNAHTISPAILYNKVPNSGKETENNNVYYFLNYSFRVPFSLLASNSVISKLALVPEIFTGNPEEICAYFRLSEPIDLSEYDSNYTLIVD
jgi:hypothetical protein